MQAPLPQLGPGQIMRSPIWVLPAMQIYISVDNLLAPNAVGDTRRLITYCTLLATPKHGHNALCPCCYILCMTSYCSQVKARIRYSFQTPTTDTVTYAGTSMTIPLADLAALRWGQDSLGTGLSHEAGVAKATCHTNTLCRTIFVVLSKSGKITCTFRIRCRDDRNHMIRRLQWLYCSTNQTFSLSVSPILDEDLEALYKRNHTKSDSKSSFTQNFQWEIDTSITLSQRAHRYDVYVFMKEICYVLQADTTAHFNDDVSIVLFQRGGSKFSTLQAEGPA